MVSVTNRGISVRPTAWFWWASSLGSLIATIVLAICGAVVSFTSGALTFVSNGWSVLFWLLLFVSIVFFCVSVALLPATRRREVRAGYTTLPTMVRQIEWRDHATGLVLRERGDPTPTGPIAELRKAARARDEASG